MLEIARITLENEMDLVLVHKRTMKLAELSGLSLSAQTTFATAVSEVSRATIEHGKNGCLTLAIHADPKRETYIVASIKDEGKYKHASDPGLTYAKRLVNKLQIHERDAATHIELYFALPQGTKSDNGTIENWKGHFTDEAPISPYDEIKRKNEQLKELAEKLQESEAQYKTLTNTLPLLIFSFEKEGRISFANEWFWQYTGLKEGAANISDWKEMVHPGDQHAFSVLLSDYVAETATNGKAQCRLRNQYSGAYLWHQVSLSPQRDEKRNIDQWIAYAVDIHAQKEYEAALQDNRELTEIRNQLEKHKSMLEKNVFELNRSNLELQQFAFIASHDLQEPLRKVAFYSDLLMNKNKDALDAKGQAYLKGIFQASSRMRNLINDILSFSQVNSNAARFKSIDLNMLVQEVLQHFDLSIAEKKAVVHLEALPVIDGDEELMLQVFSNLVSNALKYARKEVVPLIQISSTTTTHETSIRIKDNGVGFDNKYAEDMFHLFQRLHSKDEYEGTGLGLAICRKIISLHGGSITAKGIPGEGSVFTIRIPLKQVSFPA